MEQSQVSCPELNNFLEYRQKEILALAQQVTKEVIEKEFDLFEFDLFLGSLGKNKLDKSTKKVMELRNKVDNGKINLSKYEDMFNY
ncbi:MAG TPA: hypothetical protein VJB35_01895 [Candidatus Nanoarchaeia archaeon]|nr:hypothetical protein [Candidatus Nanoarchaeia archaeon]